MIAKGMQQMVGSCLLAALTFCASAQTGNHVVNISTADGLSQGVVFDILQDSEGFLWFGTKDGLNRYDGYRFEVFTNDPDDPWSISGNTVTLLFEDSKGRIWAATDNRGVDIYDKITGRFHHILYDPTQPGGLSGNHILTIVEDSSGYFLLNVDGKEINMLKLEDAFFQKQHPPQVIRIPVPKQDIGRQMPGTMLRVIVKDEKGRIWVGGPGVIYQLDVQKAQLTLVKEGVSIGATIINEDGSLWGVGQNQAHFHWDGEKATLLPDDFHAVMQFARDKQGHIWAVRPDSLFGMDLKNSLNTQPTPSAHKGIFFRWAPDIPATDYPMASLAIDNSGIIWVGSNGYGLYQINPNQTRFTHLMPGISVRNIAVVSADKYFLWTYSNWFTEDGTFLRLDPLRNTWKAPSVDYMMISRTGEYWMKYTGPLENIYQLKKYSPNTKTEELINIPWVHYDTQPMLETENGMIWLTGFNQLLTAVNPDTKSLSTYDLKDGKKTVIDNQAQKVLSRDFSTAIYEDINGVIWVGTGNGMIRCERKGKMPNELEVRHFKNIPGNQQSLSYNHVMCFLDDPVQPEQYLWVCTKGGGLNRFDKKEGTFLRLTKKDGLPDNVVYGILSDEQGNLWGSTNKGIFCLLQSGLREGQYVFRNFSKKDGLQEEEFNTGAYAKLPDGRLIFGGVNGYNVFDPKDLLTTDFHPPVYITRILVNNQPVTPGDGSNILEKTILFTKSITLLPKHEILTLEFASLDYTAPDRNRYRYQLVGADDSWVEAGSHRSATFLQLPPGAYTFRVQGTNSQGVWSEHIAELQINVLPPWWKTWWAYLAYIALLAGGIFLAMRFYVNRQKLSQQLDFEKREAERVRELDAQKTQLYMNMTHEFRTPLTIILGMAKQLKDNPDERSESSFDMIIRNGRNLLGLVNKMLNLSKLESGKLQLDLVRDDVVVFLRSLVSSFSSLVEQKEIQLHFLPEVNEYMTAYDPDKLQQITSNLITNAYKFTPEGGNIYIMVKVENESLVIRVKDTGRGISPEDIGRIFDRFYQVDAGTTRQFEGTGIGLALTKELVTLMGGQIRAQSPPIGASIGTEFIVTIPDLSQTKAGIKAANGARPADKKPLSPATAAPPAVPVQFLPEPAPVHQEKYASQKTGPAEKSAGHKQPIILLVEDNADVVAYVATCLKEKDTGNGMHPDGYKLVVAENGQEGMELATELIPDLIISDVMMPVMDGFELCRQLKSDARTDHIPVVILTARADMNSKLEGLEIGANAYLSKPFERQELLLTVKNLFDLRNKLRKKFQENLDKYEPVESDGQPGKPIQQPLVFEDKFVAKVTAIIEAHLSDFNFSVGQIAGEFHLSHSQLARKLDAVTGYAPNQFIRLVRLNKAKAMLMDEAIPITAVAYDCGFNDPSYFSRIFKKEFGETPSEWRETYLQLVDKSAR
jgi:signal transduction histidine kinase/CheY-like chemotaxis protein/AraC-like DNA-binding protein/ligand-binding sensor domain-containing protein